MNFRHQPDNAKLPNSIRYGGIDHVGPGGIYRSATRQPAVSLGTFSTRIRRLLECNDISDKNVEESLWLSTTDFKRKYGTRRTLVEIDGHLTDLMGYYIARSTQTAVRYSNFWHRVTALNKTGRLTDSTLAHALTLPAATWRSFYGGGRRKVFIYGGGEYPDQVGKPFHSVAAFMRTVERYDDRALIWSRLKAGWDLDDALTVPVAFASYRDGSIYRITRRKTGAVYVGLTVNSVVQRWVFHMRAAAGGATSKLHVAIREDCPGGFDIDVLEDGIKDPTLLAAREAYWVERLGGLGPNGLNSAKAGGLGGPRGKPIDYQGRTFRSLEEAVEVLSKEHGLARHVTRTRVKKDSPLPQPDQVRQHSKHPDAGSNLFRRWRALLKRHAKAVSDEWTMDYDKFKIDVSPVPADMQLVRKRPAEPWGQGNVEWVSIQTKVERVHGKGLVVHGVAYPSITAVANAHGIAVSTLKFRVNQKGMTVEQAIVAPLGPTSFGRANQPIMVDGREFSSKRSAILYIAKSRGITEHQAKYRLSAGTY